MNDALRISGRSFLGDREGRVGDLPRVKPVRYGDLRGADGVRQVDVQQGIVTPVRAILALRRPGGEPEVRPVRLVDSGAGADDIEASEFAERSLEHPGESRPRGHVGFDEQGSRGFVSGRVLGDELLGFGAEREVCDDDIAIAR